MRSPPDEVKPATTRPPFWGSVLIIVLAGLMIGVFYVWGWKLTLRGFFAAWLVGSLIAALALLFGPMNRLRFPVLMALMSIAGGFGGLIFAFVAGHDGSFGTPVLFGAAYGALIALVEGRVANAA